MTIFTKGKKRCFFHHFKISRKFFIFIINIQLKLLFKDNPTRNNIEYHLFTEFFKSSKFIYAKMLIMYNKN